MIDLSFSASFSGITSKVLISSSCDGTSSAPIESISGVCCSFLAVAGSVKIFAPDFVFLMNSSRSTKGISGTFQSTRAVNVGSSKYLILAHLIGLVCSRDTISSHISISFNSSLLIRC